MQHPWPLSSHPIPRHRRPSPPSASARADSPHHPEILQTPERSHILQHAILQRPQFFHPQCTECGMQWIRHFILPHLLSSIKHIVKYLNDSVIGTNRVSPLRIQLCVQPEQPRCQAQQPLLPQCVVDEQCMHLFHCQFVRTEEIKCPSLDVLCLAHPCECTCHVPNIHRMPLRPSLDPARDTQRAMMPSPHQIQKPVLVSK